MKKFGLAAMLLAALMMVGCEKEKKNTTDKTNKVKKSGGHSHAHGPKGEVMFEIEGDGIDLHAEYLFSKSTNKCTVAFCDDHGKKPVALKVDKIEIVYEDARYPLKAVDAKDGKAAEYVSDASDKLAIIAKNRPHLEVTVDGKTAKVRLPKPH